MYYGKKKSWENLVFDPVEHEEPTKIQGTICPASW